MITVQQLFNANPNGLGPEEIAGYISSKIPGLPNPLPDEVNQIIQNLINQFDRDNNGKLQWNGDRLGS